MSRASILAVLLLPTLAQAASQGQGSCVLHNETEHRVVLVPLPGDSTAGVFRLDAWRPRSGRPSEAETLEVDFGDQFLPEASLGHGEEVTFRVQRHPRQAPAPQGDTASEAAEEQLVLATFGVHLEAADGTRRPWGTLRFLHFPDPGGAPQSRLRVQPLDGSRTEDSITVASDDEGHWLESQGPAARGACVIL